MTLIPKMPEVDRSPLAEVHLAKDRSGPDGEVPSGSGTQPGLPHYQGFVGEQSALGAAEGNSFAAFRDGTSYTLLIVESQASVPWTKPEDLSYEKPEDAKQAQPFPGEPLNFLTADGAAHRMMPPVDWEKLAKMITRAGREPVDP